jgi:hypothetical protein
LRFGGAAFADDAARWLAQPKLAAGERRLASLMPVSWNQIACWLQQIDELRTTAT